MPRRVELPPTLRSTPFSVADAKALGITRVRLLSADLWRPFHGVRSTSEVVSHLDRCIAYAQRMRTGNAFGYLTAAMLWDAPLPLATAVPSVNVVAPVPRRAPEGTGVTGHRAVLGSSEVVERYGVPVTSAARTWCDLAEVLDVVDLVAVGEWMITGNPYAEILPVTTRDDLMVAVASRTGSRGTPVRRRAIALVREGALSRPETLLRLLLEGCGIPPPLINVHISDDRGSFLAMPDLCWPEFRLAVEYEGRHHAETAQFRRDIKRIEKLVDHEWLVVKISALDLFDDPDEAVARVARRLARQGWTGSVKMRQSRHFAR